MALDATSREKDAAAYAREREAERGERIAALMLRRGELDDEEVVLLREVFAGLVSVHQHWALRFLLRRGLQLAEAEDVLQEGLVRLYLKIVAAGFPNSVPGLLWSLLRGLARDHVHARSRCLETPGLPSSGSEPPLSPLDLARAIDLKKVSPLLLPQLTEEQRDVFEIVYLDRLSHADAAEALDIPLGTVKSRLMAAKKRLAEILEPLLPDSQRS
jgi:RNA polymerase sigma-70 factor (ECF subfamily)